jgi:hypothetical protein
MRGARVSTFSVPKRMTFAEENLSGLAFFALYQGTTSVVPPRAKMIRALAPARAKLAPNASSEASAIALQFHVFGQQKAQGLKPNLVWAFMARLKSCPDTKPNVVSVEGIAYSADFPDTNLVKM